MSVRTAEAAVAEAPWQRLSPRMLLVHPVMEVAKFLPAVIALFLFGPGRSASWWAVLLTVVPVALGIGRWITTSYRTTQSQLQLRSGLLNRNTLTAPLDRVRTVDITAHPLHRLLGLATVKVGTGADKPVELDALRRADAEALRVALLNRSVDAPGPDTGAAHDTSTSGGALTTASGGASSEPAETTLATFSATWLRFAPFTLTGLVAVGAVFGFGAQFLDQLNWGAAERAAENALDRVADQPWWLLGLVLAVAVLVVLVLASILMYAVTYGGFRLTRQRGDTLHIVRGLLTTRSTTLEERRMRGAVLLEPCLMRPVRGAKANALVTGSFASDDDNTTSDLLMPPAPRGHVVDVLGAVTDDVDAWTVPLRGHGPAATRRRYIRAFESSLIVPLVVLAVALWIVTPPTWVFIASGLPVLASGFVGRGRATALGHALTDRHLVARAGIFPRSRSVLRRDGIIGWTWTQTLFQRRVGLVTLRAMTAASPGHVDVLDIPIDAARDLVGATTPELLRPFLADAAP